MYNAKLRGLRYLVGLSLTEMAGMLRNHLGESLSPNSLKDYENGRVPVPDWLETQIGSIEYKHSQLADLIAETGVVPLEDYPNGWIFAAVARAIEMEPDKDIRYMDDLTPEQRRRKLVK